MRGIKTHSLTLVPTQIIIYQQLEPYSDTSIIISTQIFYTVGALLICRRYRLLQKEKESMLVSKELQMFYQWTCKIEK